MLSIKLYPIVQECNGTGVKRNDRKRLRILDAAYSLFRERGFDNTSIADINARVGGSRATIYSYFSSKERLFIECIEKAVADYMAGSLEHLELTPRDPGGALLNFGINALTFLCSPEQLELRRLVIAEAARLETGKLFFNKIRSLRARLSAFLAACMREGSLEPHDPGQAAQHFGALLESEILEPLLLRARAGAPDAQEIRGAAQHAVGAFLRAYAPAKRRVAPSGTERGVGREGRAAAQVNGQPPIL